MARVPLPEGLKGVENLPRTTVSLRNCFNDGKGNVINRPGIENLLSLEGSSRGIFEFNNSLYLVNSNDLVKLTIDRNTGAVTTNTVGLIAGPQTVDVAVGFNHAVIIVRGGSGYTLDKNDVLTQITDLNFFPSNSVVHIDGRFVYIPSDGEPAFFSDVGDGSSIDPLSFFDAEELPDTNKVTFSLRNTLYIGGTDSFQLYRNTGATPVPFVPIPGSRILSGFIGGILEYRDTYLFVGREREQDFGIYAIGQGVAQKISNEVIDKALSESSQVELEETIASRFKWRGYDIAVFTFGNNSFGFFNGQWFKLDTQIEGRLRPWDAGFIREFDGIYYTSSGSNLGKLENINTDNGNRIRREMQGFFEQEDDDYFPIQSLELGISQGYNTADGSVALQMSHDGVLYEQPVYVDLGDIGEYADKVVWDFPGGLGTYEGFAAYKIFTTEDIKFSSKYLIANIGE